MSCLAVFLLAAALTPEDILTIREPGDLRLAPDGARADGRPGFRRAVSRSIK